MKTINLLSFLLVSTVCFADGQINPYAGDAEAIKEGEALYMQHCAACHGSDGSGGVGHDLSDDSWHHGSSDAKIYNSIAEGLGEGRMPAWKDSLSEEEIWKVIAFLQTLGKE